MAEHSFACAVLATWLAQAYYPELETGKVLHMALLHDFGEIYAGDLIPGDAVEPEENTGARQARLHRCSASCPVERPG